MNSNTSVVGIILVGSILGVPAAPSAWSATGPTCTFSADLVLQPGLSSHPSSGTFETPPDRDGTYRCQAFGSERSGPAGTSGRYGTRDGDSCGKGGEGEGTLRLGGGGSDGGGSEGDYTFTYSPFSEDGVATGQFHSDRFEGTVKLTAKNGDCALDQVTRIHLDGEGTVTS